MPIRPQTEIDVIEAQILELQARKQELETMPPPDAISADARKLVEHFDECAQSWGWQSDQGYGSSVEMSEKNYETAKQALIDYIAKLEGS